MDSVASCDIRTRWHGNRFPGLNSRNQPKSIIGCLLGDFRKRRSPCRLTG
jgi:hypothetical protein